MNSVSWERYFPEGLRPKVAYSTFSLEYIPKTDTDLALLEFPGDLLVDVSWDRREQTFFVSLLDNRSKSVIHRRPCGTVDLVIQTVKDFAEESFDLNQRHAVFGDSVTGLAPSIRPLVFGSNRRSPAVVHNA